MPHELALVTTAVAASSACNLVMSGFFLILLHAQSTRAREDIEAWAAGALQRRRALARGRRRRRRREVVIRPYKPPLPYKRFSFNLNLWADLWVEKRLRFTKAEIALILPYLRLDEINWKVDGNGYRPSQTKAFAITLASLAFPLRQHDMIAWFGCSASQLSVIKNVVCCHLVTVFRDRLFWDRARLTMEKMREYAAVINQHGGGDNIWGWIDGTVLRICRPTEGQRKTYSGHKKFHGYKFQGVITPDGMMASLAGPVVGSRGDWYMFKETGIEDEILRLWREEQVRREERLYLYGDPAYCASATTMGAYKRAAGAQLSAQQHLFNAQMSSCRISVEHGFAHVQNKWMKNAFHHSLRAGSSPVAAYFLTAVLFSNLYTCLRGNQIGMRFGLVPPTLDEYLV